MQVRGFLLFVIAAWVTVGATTCSRPAADIATLSGSIFGTTWQVHYRTFPHQPSAETLKEHIQQELERVDGMMSTWQEDSALNQLNAAPVRQWANIPPELFSILALSQQIAQQTDGAFDVTVGPLVNLWGFGPDGVPEQIPDADLVARTRARVGMDKVLLDDSESRVYKSAALYLDLSAIAKGYAVDQISTLLTTFGLEHHLVEIGGELRVHGRKSANHFWQVGIERPQSSHRAVQKILPLEDIAMATSGNYRNYFELNGMRYAHTIDPKTGYPVRHTLVSVTVLHQHTAMADALATAFMVMGTARAQIYAQQHGVAALLITQSEQGFSEHPSTAFRAYVAQRPS